MYQSEDNNSQPMSTKVKVTRNQPGSKSIRMQIPASMKEFLSLEAGDMVDVELTIESGKHVAKIKKTK